MISETTHCKCQRCGSLNLRKNGHSTSGKAKYHCKDCNKYGTISNVAQQRAERYEQVEKLLLERTSLRGIQRVTGVSGRRSGRPTIIKLAKKK